MTQIENITRNGKTSLSFVGVPSTVSEKNESYMMILEYHEKYGEISRRDRELC